MSNETLKLIKDNEARWVDLRFTDTKGKEQHVTIPASTVDEDFFSEARSDSDKITKNMILKRVRTIRQFWRIGLTENLENKKNNYLLMKKEKKEL